MPCPVTLGGGNEVARVHHYTLGATAAARPLAARAQPLKVARIGFLGLVSPSSQASRVAAFRTGLRDLGWIEGRNLLIEFRWAEGITIGCQRWPRNSFDLTSTCSSRTGSWRLGSKKATSTIPIVITAVSDMLALGLVSSLSRPEATSRGCRPLPRNHRQASRVDQGSGALSDKGGHPGESGKRGHPIRTLGNRGDFKGGERRTARLRDTSAE